LKKSGPNKIRFLEKVCTKNRPIAGTSVQPTQRVPVTMWIFLVAFLLVWSCLHCGRARGIVENIAKVFVARQTFSLHAAKTFAIFSHQVHTLRVIRNARAQGSDSGKIHIATGTRWLRRRGLAEEVDFWREKVVELFPKI